MLIATFAETTGWAGKTITWDDGVLTLEGQGAVTSKAVMGYDAGGLLDWAPGGMRAWVDSLADGVPATPPAAAPPPKATVVHVYTTASPATPPPPVAPVRVVRAKRGTPRWVFAVVGVVVVLGIAAAVALAVVNGSKTPSDGQSADGGNAGSQPNGTWVRVISWTGGGPGPDTRDSASFTLEGGHQRAMITTTAVAGADSGMAPGGWTLISSDDAAFVNLNPPDIGTWEPDFYRSAGSYYLSSHTVDCTWTITISELR